MLFDFFLLQIKINVTKPYCFLRISKLILLNINQRILQCNFYQYELFLLKWWVKIGNFFASLCTGFLKSHDILFFVWYCRRPNALSLRQCYAWEHTSSMYFLPRLRIYIVVEYVSTYWKNTSDKYSLTQVVK